MRLVPPKRPKNKFLSSIDMTYFTSIINVDILLGGQAFFMQLFLEYCMCNTNFSEPVPKGKLLP
jgi:hypothetical protein